MSRFSKLIEGASQAVAGKVRDFFARAPEREAQELRRGISTIYPGVNPFASYDQKGASINEILQLEWDLHNRYIDYEEMDGYPDLSVALDIYADESTTPDLGTGQSIWVTSKSQKLANELNRVLHDVIRVNDDYWAVARNLCKYGSTFGELLVTDKGLVGINYLPSPTMRRMEGVRGDLLGFLQDFSGRTPDGISVQAFQQMMMEMKQDRAKWVQNNPYIRVFEDWEIVHWRLRGRQLRSVYGWSVIEAARWVWKRLSLLEDSLLVYKLERAPSRYAFFIDVGKMDAERGLAYINRVKNAYTRKRMVNPNTGKLDLRVNTLGFDEDFFIPTRDGKRITDIQQITGPDYSETGTVEYYLNKLVAATKVPKSYMGYGGESTRGPLSAEDIRFARSTMRIQQALRGGYSQALRVHLVASGANVDRAQYDMRTCIPSQILELARTEVMSAVSQLASTMGEFVSKRWILINLFKFTEEEALAVMKERGTEQLAAGQVDAQVSQMSMAAQSPEAAPPEATAPGEAPPAEGLSRGERQVLQEIQRLEKRLEDVVKKSKAFAPSRDSRRWLEGSAHSDAIADNKIRAILRDNRELAHRLDRLGGLMSDIREGMRPLGSSGVSGVGIG